MIRFRVWWYHQKRWQNGPKHCDRITINFLQMIEWSKITKFMTDSTSKSLWLPWMRPCWGQWEIQMMVESFINGMSLEFALSYIFKSIFSIQVFNFCARGYLFNILRKYLGIQMRQYYSSYFGDLCKNCMQYPRITILLLACLTILATFRPPQVKSFRIIWCIFQREHIFENHCDLLGFKFLQRILSTQYIHSKSSWTFYCAFYKDIMHFSNPDTALKNKINNWTKWQYF